MVITRKLDDYHAAHDIDTVLLLRAILQGTLIYVQHDMIPEADACSWKDPLLRAMVAKAYSVDFWWSNV